MREKRHPKIEEIDLTDIMYALSDPARVEIVRMIAAEKRPMTCGELNAERPKSSMSHHFKILRDSGILKTEIDGKEHLNSLRTAEVESKFPGVFKALLKNITKRS
ncbi:MAG: ArsR family transcriptional regulator [Proteobacteria bacterium]|nr:MAG: ArsR family transcriptional regulator [Pseudomonadota bacterium]